MLFFKSYFTEALIPDFHNYVISDFVNSDISVISFVADINRVSKLDYGRNYVHSNTVVTVAESCVNSVTHLYKKTKLVCVWDQVAFGKNWIVDILMVTDFEPDLVLFRLVVAVDTILRNILYLEVF